MVTRVTRKPGETLALAERIGRCLGPGDVVALSGELGAGKTLFAQGLARGLDVAEPVNSPTFTIVQEYAGRIPVRHVDAYRLRGPEELADLGWDALLDGRGALLVEWPERILAALPEERLEVRLIDLGGDRRRIEIEARGERLRRLLHALFRSRNGDPAGGGADAGD